MKTYKIGDIVTISDGFDRMECHTIIDIIKKNGEDRYKLDGIFKYFSAIEFKT